MTPKSLPKILALLAFTAASAIGQTGHDLKNARFTGTTATVADGVAFRATGTGTVEATAAKVSSPLATSIAAAITTAAADATTKANAAQASAISTAATDATTKANAAQAAAISAAATDATTKANAAQAAAISAAATDATTKANAAQAAAATSAAATIFARAPLALATNPIGQAIVATRANSGNQGNGLSNGTTDLSETARVQHYITASCSGLRIVYSNTGSNLTPVTVPNAITVRAGIEEPDGSTITPVFFGGKRSVVIEPGAQVISDPLPNTYAKGDVIWSRTYVLVGSGERFYRGFGNYGDVSGQGVAAGVDYSVSGSISTTTAYMYAPFLLVGTPYAPTAVIGLVGDSIMLSTIQTPAFYGFGITALGSNFGKNYSHVLVALGSDTAQKFATSLVDFKTKLPFTAGCTSVWMNYGVNDLFASGRTLLQLQTDVLSIATRFASRGVAVWQTTITPETSSTDSWATTGNQTTVNVTYEGRRVSFNDWLRAGAPIDPTTKAPVAIGTGGALLAGSVGHPLAGYFEVADAAESARNSGIWKAGYTMDGIHPTRTGTNALAATMNPAIAR